MKGRESLKSAQDRRQQDQDKRRPEQNRGKSRYHDTNRLIDQLIPSHRLHPSLLNVLRNVGNPPAISSLPAVLMTGWLNPPFQTPTAFVKHRFKARGFKDTRWSVRVSGGPFPFGLPPLTCKFL